MSLRHEHRPTEELDATELRRMLAEGARPTYAPDPGGPPGGAGPVAEPGDVTVGYHADATAIEAIDASEAIDAIDAAAAEVALDLTGERVTIDLSLDDDGEPGFVAAPVDPRILERREGVARERRRRRVRRLAAIALAPFVGAGAVALVHSPLLDVDRIEILGSDVLTLDQLKTVGGLGLGDPMLLADLSAVRDRLDADPRFERVAIERRWPSTVVVRATDRRVLAALDGPSRSVVIGEGGIVMRETEPEEFIGRIKLDEDVDTRVGERLPDALAAAVEVITRLPFNIGWNVSESRITAEGELILTMNDGVVVVFGTVEDADAKIHAVVTMLTSNVDRRGVCRIDVRVPSAPTVRRAPNCELPPRPRDLAEQRALTEAREALAASGGEVAASADASGVVDDGSDGGPGDSTAADGSPSGADADPGGDPGGGSSGPPPAARADGSNVEPGADGAG